MVVQCTSKAEIVSTLAVYRRYDLGEVLTLYLTFYRVLAVGRGAPFEVLFVVDVGSREESVISMTVSRSGKVERRSAYLSWRSAVTRRSSDFESTIRVQPSPGQSIRAASPSS